MFYVDTRYSGKEKEKKSILFFLSHDILFMVLKL